jgi:hypothetical protein
MSEIKGTIKISENKIRLKTTDKVETYIKRQSISSNSWIIFKGEFYELELLDNSEELGLLENSEDDLDY